MRRTRIVQSIVLAAALPALFLADLSADRPFGLGFVREAGAVVGRVRQGRRRAHGWARSRRHGVAAS